ncbi:homeobox protein siamois-like [Engystomops pustulosus]|uniref:homeobox protein siamois-like n=1 Tax=Engystomops pustulosus TaxID=76066 RepID=UPI003AFA04CF
MDTELEQVLCTVLSLEEDYPALSPPPRSQDHLWSHVYTVNYLCQNYVSSNLFTLSNFMSQKEPEETLHHSNILQQTVRELYSNVGINEESGTETNIRQHRTDKAGPETNRQDKLTTFQTTKNSPTRKKTLYSNEQTQFFQNQFDYNLYPDFVSRCCISKITGILEPRIQVWFQNRRTRNPSRRTLILEIKKSTSLIVHEKLPFISMENMCL